MQTRPTGSQVLDELLHGGYERGIITTLYGPAGSGKSNITLLAAAITEKKCVFIDTEGSFSVERLRQLNPHIEQLLDNIILIKITSFSQQTKILTEIQKLVSIDTEIVIVDGIAAQYRAAMARGEENINNDLSKQINALFATASEKNIPVVLTSQVYADLEGEGVKLVGGDIIKYMSKCLLELQHDERRTITIRKHRHLPAGKKTTFVIDTVGIYAEK